jgi:uncharacterized protein with GYD domain
MAKYLIKASYTAEGVKGLMKDGGTKRLEAVRTAMQSVGGTLETGYFALGEYDFYAIVDAADHASVSALAMAAAGSGSVRVHTTVLLTPAEVDAAVKKAANYTPPGR